MSFLFFSQGPKRRPDPRRTFRRFLRLIEARFMEQA